MLLLELEGVPERGEGTWPWKQMASTADSFHCLTQLIRSQGYLLVDAISAILLSKNRLLACLVVE